jgi:hypothetical protein
VITIAQQDYPYADHPLRSAAQTSWNARNTALDGLHILETALSEPAPKREQQWGIEVHAALETLQRALDAQAAGDSDTGSLLSEIGTDEPRLLPRIARLRRQQQGLRDSVHTILVELAAQTDHDHIDPADIRERAADIARRLRHHRAQEADLIYEAVNINLGTGD